MISIKPSIIGISIGIIIIIIIIMNVNNRMIHQ